MRYIADHDLHIHSQLSSCSSDPDQTPQALLRYAQENGLKHICLTDHFWDPLVPGASDWYKPQDLDHITQSLPLPQAEGIRFDFGAETDMDQYGTIGIDRKTLDRLDFLIIPTTHLHMGGFTIDRNAGTEERAKAWVKRFGILLDAGLPFHKIGIAHLTCELIHRDPADPFSHLKVLNRIPEADCLRLFRRAERAGLGIELNFPIRDCPPGDARESLLRPYRIARRAGCRFYLGSDAHHPAELTKAKENFEQIIDTLGLTEEEKFRF